ncbi:MAG: M23 family metallopeptidase [Sphingomonadales bacterium]|nr:MAG: M23 family metallopeptidase [Sphingomonadales bacterium]
MIRKIAIVLLLLAVGYVVWVVALNMGGDAPSTSTSTPAPSPRAVSGPVRTNGPLPPAGPLVIPVAGIAAAQLADTFDDARGEGRIHDAIDIMAPRGTPVLAAAAGTVEKLFESERGGTTIYIRRPSGQWIDYYAHLDSYAAGLAEGQKIAQGQIIGTVGSTGDASPEAPHLHYAINVMAPGEGWWQGRAVNPYPLLIKGR